MQKFTLYSKIARILATTNISGGSYTENRKMYQNIIKLYSGINNTIEFEIKNSDQRRVPMAGYTITVNFYDQSQALLFTATATPILNKTGLFSVDILSSQLTGLSPQSLKGVAYLTDTASNQYILYTGDNFEAEFNVELENSFVPCYTTNSVFSVLKEFNYDMGTKSYISEIGDFGDALNQSYAAVHTAASISVDVYNNPQAIFQGPITVQACENKSSAFGNNWASIGTIIIPPYDGSTLVTNQRIYQTVDSTSTGTVMDYRYVRFTYPRNATGVNAKFNVTRHDGTYTVEVKNGGSLYDIGDELIISGSWLDGVNYVNDCIITVTAVNTIGPSKVIATVISSGTAVLGDGSYIGLPGTRFKGQLDKIVLKV